MHILNLIQADPGIFKTMAYLDTECFTHIQAYSQSFAYRDIFVHIRAHFGGSGIFMILALPVQIRCSNLFGIYFHFGFKSKHSTFFLRQYFNNNSNNNNNMTPTLTRHPHYPRQHTTYASTPPTLVQIARQFSHSIQEAQFLI